MMKFVLSSSLLCGIMLLFLSGCQTAPKPSADIKAISTMTQGLTNQVLSEEDLKRLAVQMRNDPQAQSAVRQVNSALSVEQTGVKYCPVDGQRFASSIENCPVHKVKLKTVE